ncbi:MAG: hypothetical protein FJW88_02230 [Actinobacteria bacterium]|nr:hypothetical protein [Actinomycetota bacterium]
MSVTPLTDTGAVTRQLRLVPGTNHGSMPSRLDARTRRAGRQGIAEARRRLAAIQPPEPIADRALRRAG